LKLFFISLLWRVSVSSHRFYRYINAGPYEAAAKAAIARRDPGQPDDFAVVIARLRGIAGAIILEPTFRRISGINHYVFYLGGIADGGYVAYVKADRRPMQDVSLRAAILRPNESLVILHRGAPVSSELRIAQRIVAAPHNQRSRR